MTTSLSGQPLDHLRSISSFLSADELTRLARQSTSLRHQVQPLIERKRVEQQKLEWLLLLKSFGTSEQNETALRTYGVGTINLSGEEGEAWRIAFNSLHTPPAPLSGEEKNALAQRYLPRYYEYMMTEETVPEETALSRTERRLLRQRSWHRRQYRLWIRGNCIERPISSLSEVALYDADFLTFLRIFAVDGDRFQGFTVEAAINTSRWPFHEVGSPPDSSIYARSPVDSTTDYRGILAALLCIRGTPYANPLDTGTKSGLHPALVQARLDSGVDFFQTFTPEYHGGIRGTRNNNICLFFSAVRSRNPFTLKLILDSVTIDKEVLRWIDEGRDELSRICYNESFHGNSVKDVLECSRVLAQYRHQVNLQPPQRADQIV